MSDIITLSHGSGGRLTHRLIRNIFRKYFSDGSCNEDDSAMLELPAGRLAFTTDSFVVSPVFFRGGDIGKLSVCGTVNDLVTAGADPLYLSCSFILEEGLELSELERIVESMGRTARECGVKIVTGDTKVVGRGAADKIYINTSGIGVIREGIQASGSLAKPGDSVIVTGPVGDHGCAILLERESLNIDAVVNSDCACLNRLIGKVLDRVKDVHVLRDPTRGGLATSLNEIVEQSGVGIVLEESSIPVRDQVRGVCELLGMDPLYMANEGRMILIVPKTSEKEVLEILKCDILGKDACIIGEVTSAPAGRVIMRTITGGRRIVDMMTGDMLPRIC